MTAAMSWPMIDAQHKADQLTQLLLFARQNSPYYRQLYQAIPEQSTRLTDYPILHLESFWQANGTENNQVLTASRTDGITFKSGGSTGKPKYSVFSNADWVAFTQAFGQGMRRSGLQTGESIGNLFYAGSLYASFLFITRSIEQAQAGMCYPIAGIDLHDTLAIWKEFNLSTLAGVPTTLMNLLTLLDEDPADSLSLKQFLYGGEPMFADQVERLHQYFPQCQVRSIGIAGVDYGELGWACPSGELGVHHCFDDSTYLEIVDDADQPITQMGVTGRLVLTNLTRRVMPIIRYPVGDVGMWVDPEGTPWRRFKVLGRSQDGARVGPMTLYTDDVMQLIQDFNRQGTELKIINFQIKVTHFEHKDACTLCLVADTTEADLSQLNQDLCQQLYQFRPMFEDLIAKQIVHPLRIEWLTQSELMTNPRTGKLLRLIDQRHQN